MDTTRWLCDGLPLMSMNEARLDHLTLRLDSLQRGLAVRADQLENEAVSAAATGCVTAPGRTPEVLRVIATEFRGIAEALE